ncbi:MAG: nusB [Cyanobacteria bacterium RYN_339]|nr:nusB [Cyanobacteria bacterium RYN_339]
MLNSRRVARELALLTMSQVSNRGDKTPPSPGEMLGRAADMLATEARERLEEAAATLSTVEHTIHGHYIEMREEPLNRKDIEELLAGVDKAQEAIEIIGSALELPAMVALAGAEETRTFALSQVQRYMDHKAEIDKRLEDAARNWSVDRMASLDRDVMRLAVGELLWAPEIPVEVAINEAIELAKKYGMADSGRFVNGVLSRFAEEAATLRGNKPHVV